MAARATACDDPSVTVGCLLLASDVGYSDQTLQRTRSLGTARPSAPSAIAGLAGLGRVDPVQADAFAIKIKRVPIYDAGAASFKDIGTTAQDVRNRRKGKEIAGNVDQDALEAGVIPAPRKQCCH